MSQPTNRSVNIYINSATAQQNLDNLNSKSVKLADSIRKGEAAGKDMTNSLNKLAQTKSKISELEAVMSGKLAPTFTQTKNLVRQLQRELQNLSEGTPAYAAKFKEFESANQQFVQMQSNINGVTKVMATAKDRMADFWKTAKAVTVGTLIGNTVQAAVQAIGGYISGIVSGNAKLSDSLADIQKAAGLTAEEAIKLNSSIGKIDTRTATSQLRDIAIGLGQIGEAATPETVAAIDKIVVALGDEFGGGAKEITTELGKLRNNLLDIKTSDYGEDILAIGNALNVLGAEGLATAPVVTDIAQRISGVASTFKISTGNILGVAAAMQELGINTERGSTAFVKTLQKIAVAPEAFAKVAGKSVKEFTDLINNDMMAAFNAVAVGAGKASNSNTAFAAVLKELDSDGAGASELLAKFAANQTLVESKTNLATEALKSNASITQEFNIKNTNMAANLEKLEKVFSRFITSPAINNFLSGAIGGLASFIVFLSKASSFIKDNIVAFGLWGAAIFVQIGWVKSLTNWLKLQSLAQAYSTIAMNAEIVATSALSAVKALLTLNMKRLRQEWLLMTAAMGVNPLTAVLIVVGALIVGYNQLTSKMKELSGEEKARSQHLKDINAATQEAIDRGAIEARKLEVLYNATQDLNLTEAQRIAAAKELQRLYPETFSNFKTEEILAGKATTAYKDLTAAIIAKAKASAAQSELEELAKEQRRVLKAKEDAQKTLEYVEKKNKELQKLGASAEQYDTESVKRLNKELADTETYLNNIDAKMNKVAGSIAPGATPAPAAPTPNPEGNTKKIITKIKTETKEVNDWLSKAAADWEKASDLPYQAALERFAKLIQDKKNIAGQRFIDGIGTEKDYQARIKEIQEEANFGQVIIANTFASNSEKAQKDLETLKTKKVEEGVKARLELLKSEGAGHIKEVKSILDSIDYGVQVAGSIASALGNANNQLAVYENAQLARDQAANDKKKANFQARLDAEKISQKKYNEEIAKLDEAMDKKKRKIAHDQAVRDKAMASVSAIINGITATIAALKYGPIAAAIVGTFATAQLALLAATKVPELEQGGFAPSGKGGVPSGPRHANGGISLIDDSGRKRGEMEGGEPILSRSTYANNREVVDALLDTSMNNGGRRLTWLYKQNRPLNTQRAMSTFAKGGLASGASSNAKSNNVLIDPQSAALMNAFITQLQQGVKASVVYNEWELKHKEITDLKKLGSAKPFGD